MAAELDGDGRLDLTVSGSEGPSRLWMNPGAPGRWLEVELDGTDGNRLGYGAAVEVSAAGRTWRRDLLPFRALAQGPARAHFGLGDADAVDRVVVSWPVGATTALEAPPIDGVVRIAHPLR